MAVDLITLGDLVADLVVPIESFPIEAQKHQPADYVNLEPGGTGNTLIMAQRLGLSTLAIGSVGDDDFGKSVLKMLSSEGVDISQTVTLPNSSTTTALVLVDKQAQHVFIGQFGTGDPLSFSESWENDLSQAGAIFVAGYCLRENGSLSHQSLMRSLQVAKEYDVPLFFDLGPAYTAARREHVDAVIEYTSVFLATDEELCQWTGISDPIMAAKEILNRNVTTVIVKSGGAGCCIVTEAETVQCPGFAVEVRDTAGAGDAFAAGAIYAMQQGYSLAQTGQFANAVGAATVAKLGTGTALPVLDDINQILAG